MVVFLIAFFMMTLFILNCFVEQLLFESTLSRMRDECNFSSAQRLKVRLNSSCSTKQKGQNLSNEHIKSGFMVNPVCISDCVFYDDSVHFELLC